MPDSMVIVSFEMIKCLRRLTCICVYAYVYLRAHQNAYICKRRSVVCYTWQTTFGPKLLQRELNINMLHGIPIGLHWSYVARFSDESLWKLIDPDGIPSH